MSARGQLLVPALGALAGCEGFEVVVESHLFLTCEVVLPEVGGLETPLHVDLESADAGKDRAVRIWGVHCLLGFRESKTDALCDTTRVELEGEVSENHDDGVVETTAELGSGAWV